MGCTAGGEGSAWSQLQRRSSPQSRAQQRSAVHHPRALLCLARRSFAPVRQACVTSAVIPMSGPVCPLSNSVCCPLYAVRASWFAVSSRPAVAVRAAVWAAVRSTVRAAVRAAVRAPDPARGGESGPGLTGGGHHTVRRPQLPPPRDGRLRGARAEARSPGT